MRVSPPEYIVPGGNRFPARCLPVDRLAPEVSTSPNPFDFSQYTSTHPVSQGPDIGQQVPVPVPESPFGFGTDPAFSAPLEAARPPVGWIVAAGALALLGLAGAVVLGTDVRLAVVSWLLAGPVAIGLLAVFTVRDTGQRAKPVYTAPSWVTAAYRVTLGLSLLGVVAGALRIADWAGRQW